MTKHGLSLGVCLGIAAAVAPCAARAQDQSLILQQQQLQQQMEQQQLQLQIQEQQAQLQTANSPPVVPENLQVGSQQFDGTLKGFRAYLETTKFSNPKLYAGLSPDLTRLESQQTAGRAIMGAGLVVGLASVLYAFLGQDDCGTPSVGPSFAGQVDKWSACVDANGSRTASFMVLGGVAAVAGALIGYASAPGRQDLLDLVNKHNRLSQQPLQLQIGYDPTQRLAFSGAAVAF